MNRRKKRPPDRAASGPGLLPGSAPAVDWSGLAPAAIGLYGLAMLGWCWGRCPDVLIDFGRELYVPWRLSEGATLYGEIAYFNGPLSPYLNALEFSLFRPSVSCLAISNAVILALSVWLMAQILSALASRRTVYLCLFAFLSIFAFADYYRDGNNYNFIYPYSHEATHGLACSLAAIYFLWRSLAGQVAAFSFACGAFAGLTFLTKPEIFTALAIALAAGLVLAACLAQSTPERWTRCGAFLAGALLPPLVAFGLLSASLPMDQALVGTLGGFAYMFDPQLVSLPFYRNVMGTANLPDNLLKIGTWILLYAAVFVPAAVLALRLRASAKWKGAAALSVFVAVAALAVCFHQALWVQSLSPLPLFMALALLVSAGRFFRGRQDPILSRRAVLEVVMLTFSLALMLKIVLNVMAMWYGFVLALPATLMLMVVMLDWIPAAIQRRGGSGTVFQAAFIEALAVFIGTCLYVDKVEFDTKTVRVGSGGDAIMTYPVFGAPLNNVLEDLARHSTPEQTLIVMPEGVMINYLSRRLNPTPYFNFLPPEMIMFGEEPMLAALEANPPDFLVWAPRQTGDYGYQGLGIDYGVRLGGWLQKHYQPLAIHGRADGYQLTLARYSKPSD